MAAQSDIPEDFLLEQITGDIDINDDEDDVYTGPERRKGEDRRHAADALDRRSGADRRGSSDRRSGWDRRRGPGRRRDDVRRSAEEGEMNDEQFEFIMAIEEYKKANRRAFPTYTEILEIAIALGYRKVAEAKPLVKK